MILPYGTSKNNTSSSSNKVTSSNVSHANNLNSILMSLKDTLHLVINLFINFKFNFFNKFNFFKFLIGISNLNYDYDGYLQRILQTIISNFLMKFQMVILFFLLNLK